VCRLAYRTIIREPSKYSTNSDRIHSLESYRQWAEQEWRIASADCPNTFGKQADYAGGFVSGFVDFVRLGGVGEPPPVPPREYWEIAARAGNGKQRVEQWFDGYRHGARVAFDGGYRELATLQNSLTAGAYADSWSPAMEAETLPASSDGVLEELPLPNDVASPFRDDLPQTNPIDSTATESASSDDETAPGSRSNNLDPLKPPSSRNPSSDADKLNSVVPNSG
jgi:hypothetical protein